ncbi:MAG: hypothetical protein K9J13_10440 [Saprospiraceae bacterium]|nr:hypothetical protein [Saprospiraceae bacterium]
MGYNLRSKSVTRRISHGTGFNKSGGKNNLRSGGRINNRQIHQYDLHYLTYKRFGMLNEFANILPFIKASYDEKLKAIILLDYLFKSGKSEQILNAVKQELKQNLTVKLISENLSPNKQIHLLAHLENYTYTHEFENSKQIENYKAPKTKNLWKVLKKTAVAASILILSALTTFAQAQKDSIAVHDTVYAEASGDVYRITPLTAVDGAKVTFTPSFHPSHKFITTTGPTFSLDSLPIPTVDSIPDTIPDTTGMEEHQTIETVIANNGGRGISISGSRKIDDVIIYNIAGQRVTTIDVDGNSFYWDGTNQSGARVSTGVYVAQLIGENKEEGVVKLFHNEAATLEQPQTPPQPSTTSRLAFSSPSTTSKTTSPKGTVSATYNIHIEPTSQSITFIPYDTTVTLVEGFNNLGIISVKPIPPLPQTKDVSGTVEEYFTSNSLNNVKVRFRNTQTGNIIDSAFTNANGDFAVEDLPTNTPIVLEYGGLSTHFARKDAITFPLVITASDTTLTGFDLMLPRKYIPVPHTVNDTITPDSIQVTAQQIKARIQGPPFYNRFIDDIEEAMGRPILLHLDPTWTTAQTNGFYQLLAQGDSLFYGQEASPWQIVSTAFDLSTSFLHTVSSTYNKDTNYFSGQIGYNIRNGPDYTYNKATSIVPQYGLQVLIFGGQIDLSLGANGFNKEMYGRRVGHNDVTMEPSFMNPIGIHPTYTDRALHKLLRENRKQRFNTTNDSFTLKYVYEQL